MSAFVLKLSARFELSPEDRKAIEALPALTKSYASGSSITCEDTPTHYVGIVEQGFASRFKLVKKTTRQITGFLLPGDALDIPSIWLGKPCAHVVANKETEIRWLKQSDVRSLCFSRSNIATALWLDTLIDAGIAQEWLANVGQRGARDRIAHLLLEMAARQPCTAQGDRFELPLTQSDLACALGLSLVHTNKSLRLLEADGVIRKKGHVIEIVDRAALETQIGFDPSYLWPGSLKELLDERITASPRQAEPTANL